MGGLLTGVTGTNRAPPLGAPHGLHYFAGMPISCTPRIFALWSALLLVAGTAWVLWRRRAGVILARADFFFADWPPLFCRAQTLDPSKGAADRPGDYVRMDAATRRNLEIETTLGGREEFTLAGLMDRCATAMGSRLLRRWLHRPIRDRGELKRRQQAQDVLRTGGHVAAVAYEDLLHRDDVDAVYIPLPTGIRAEVGS